MCSSSKIYVWSKSGVDAHNWMHYSYSGCHINWTQSRLVGLEEVNLKGILIRSSHSLCCVILEDSGIKDTSLLYRIPLLILIPSGSTLASSTLNTMSGIVRTF